MNCLHTLVSKRVETMGLFGLISIMIEILICLLLNVEVEIFSGSIMSFGEITAMEHFLILLMPLVIIVGSILKGVMTTAQI